MSETRAPYHTIPTPAPRPALSLPEAAAKALSLLEMALSPSLLMSRTCVECAAHELRQALAECAAREGEGGLVEGLAEETARLEVAA